MTTLQLNQLTEEYPLTQEQIDQYRRDGFIKLEDVLTGDTLQACRDAVARAVDAERDRGIMGGEANKPGGTYSQIFTQKVNLWERHGDVRELVVAPRLANIAKRLMGEDARVWHDQALFKEAKTGSKTPWHQDSPYWPHTVREKQTSIWIALKDATVENGCMSFMPGTHKLGPKEAVRLGDDPQNVYDVAPETRGIKPITHELKAGSATFHNGLTFHYAGPNRSDEEREAFVVIYMPASTTYDGLPHVVTDGMNLTKGEVIAGESFPLVSK